MKHGVRWPHLLASGGGVFVVVYIVLRLLTTRGHAMPHNGWIAVVVLLILAALMVAAGWPIRTYLLGRAVVIPDPQRARRTVVAAQASALAGAALIGWYLAQAAVHVRTLDLPRSKDGFILCLVLAASAAALMVAGLVVQHWCRIDHKSDDDDDPSRRGGGGAEGAAATH